MTTVRRLIILGSTGSIGRNTLAVVRHLRSIGGPNFEIAGLATGKGADVIAEQAREFGVKNLAIASSDGAGSLRPLGKVHEGPDGALALIDSIARPGDVVMASMVGYAGLAPTLRAIEKGCTIALANKETLVAAGALVTAAAAKRGVRILPVDSEHNAIFQCLRAGDSTQVRRIVLTASGGPFRTWPRERMMHAPVEEALRHPTWNMGAKITIDSASMMNKALEVIEAHWLFNLPAEGIDAIIHPQSIVHGFVEFLDGSVIAQLSPPDMKLPIQEALTWPDRFEGSSPRLDWRSLSGLVFEAVDHDRFPAIQLAWKAVRAGGTSGAILNAANEAAVSAYLKGGIHFGRISELVASALESIAPTELRSLSDAAAADAAARAFVEEHMTARSRA